MAGHSKWANIQHRKGAQDARKAKIFTKLIREITTSARLGSGDIKSNPRLRAAVDKALSHNMSRDTIDKAIKRGIGDEQDNSQECVYEGYGPAGVAFLIECMTDNKNRTVGEVRHALTKAGGSLGTSGSVSYLFKKQGLITFPPNTDFDKVLSVAIEALADDVLIHEDKSIEVITSFENFGSVKDALDEQNLISIHAEVLMNAETKIQISSQELISSIQGLIERLEDLDDVQNVYTNAENL